MQFQRMTFCSGGGTLWPALVMMGILFILAGVLIAVYPKILVAIVSGIIIFIGISLVGAGLASRRSARMASRHTVNGYEIIEP